MTPIIQVENLSKAFRFTTIPKNATVKDFVIRTMRFEHGVATFDALKRVSFTVDRGVMLGVIGRNGSGKTTLMRILAGILQADAGRVSVHGSIAPLLTLGTSFHPDLTGRESARIELLAMGLRPKQLPPMLDAIVEFSEIGDFFDAPVRTYSQGMLMRLTFAVAIAVDPDVLLLDEVLAVGDGGFAMKCDACLDDFRKRGKTIVLVTHHTPTVEHRCDVALWLDKGEVAGYGEPHEIVAGYHAQLAEQTAQSMNSTLQAPNAPLLNAAH